MIDVLSRVEISATGDKNDGQRSQGVSIASKRTLELKDPIGEEKHRTDITQKAVESLRYVDDVDQVKN